MITQDGQACLADFGITGALRGFTYHDYKLRTLRYMAPERLPLEDLPADYLPTIDGPSKESDVYSLAMTSFMVCSSVVSRPTGDTITPIIIRSSREHCHTVAVIRST